MSQSGSGGTENSVYEQTKAIDSSGSRQRPAGIAKKNLGVSPGHFLRVSFSLCSNTDIFAILEFVFSTVTEHCAQGVFHANVQIKTLQEEEDIMQTTPIVDR